MSVPPLGHSMRIPWGTPTACLNSDGILKPTGKTIGLDVGVKEFYTDSNGRSEPNPKFYRTGEKRLKFRQRCVSRQKKGSANRRKAINKLGRVHLKISRQREEHAKRVARCVIQSNDLVAYVSEAGRVSAQI
jgi:putative transposase